jgi:hypothetical protein
MGTPRTPLWRIALGKWFEEHAGTPAPMDLVRSVEVAIKKRINSAMAQGRRAERELWSRDAWAWRGVTSDPLDTDVDSLP